jgi:hypothetical protein
MRAARRPRTRWARPPRTAPTTSGTAAARRGPPYGTAGETRAARRPRTRWARPPRTAPTTSGAAAARWGPLWGAAGAVRGVPAEGRAGRGPGRGSTIGARSACQARLVRAMRVALQPSVSCPSVQEDARTARQWHVLIAHALFSPMRRRWRWVGLHHASSHRPRVRKDFALLRRAGQGRAWLRWHSFRTPPPGASFVWACFACY